MTIQVGLLPHDYGGCFVYMGHSAVAVLDGGWSAWQRAGLPVRAGVEQNDARCIPVSPREE